MKSSPIDTRNSLFLILTNSAPSRANTTPDNPTVLKSYVAINVERKDATSAVNNGILRFTFFTTFIRTLNEKTFIAMWKNDI